MKNLVYGIIPARGGSKSIPLKNIKLLKNIPLIEHSIQTALKSKLIDKLIVSTDHEDIIKIIDKYIMEVFVKLFIAKYYRKHIHIMNSKKKNKDNQMGEHNELQ